MCKDKLILMCGGYRERQAREARLRTPIEEDNKGFALLKKMGYKYVQACP